MSNRKIDLYGKKIQDSAIPRVLLRPEEAAFALGVSRSTLDKNLYPNGACVPYFRLGTRLLFALDDLIRWAHEQTLQQQRDASKRTCEEDKS